MTIDELRLAAETYLAPLLSAQVLPALEPCQPYCSRVAALDPSRIGIKASDGDTERIVINRTPGFPPEELQIAKDFTEELFNIYGATAQGYRQELLSFLPARAIARHLGGMEATKIVLRQFEKWAARTYEGGAISSLVGIDPGCTERDVLLAELFEHDFSAVLSNGFDTLLLSSPGGSVGGARQLSVSEDNLRFAPYRLSPVAGWSEGNKVAFVLNRLGEQLVFKGKKLIFAKRRGEWRYYSHEMYIRQMQPPQKRELREAVYESCIDTSFARTGGCIIIVRSGSVDDANELISSSDRLDGTNQSIKTKTIKTMTNKKFQKLDRRLRQELLALDGATILTHDGDVLAVGAIISVPSGSDGGGRRAAAKKGSTLGLGIKVSEDGEITAFKNEEQVFTA
ncbi:MAG: hypothetical protein KQH53_05470 [Desulfarculaceae bacterium]|nr:hypothetical protein [Desulfarculaceae bacterium]